MIECNTSSILITFNTLPLCLNKNRYEYRAVNCRK